LSRLWSGAVIDPLEEGESKHSLENQKGDQKGVTTLFRAKQY